MAVVVLALCATAYWQTRWSGWLVMAAAAAIIVVLRALRGLDEIALLLQVRRRWRPRGIRCLIVYSNSPNWREYIEATWLTRIGSATASLNWSERASWPRTLESRLFRHFLGSEIRNFSPAVLVFRGFRRPLIFRFFYAFQESRSGRPHYLRMLEEQMFRALEEEHDR